jgi:hypothetical protein
MTKKEALSLLKRHNLWRRGAEIEMEEPKQLGLAIDKVIELLSKTKKSEKRK